VITGAGLVDVEIAVLERLVVAVERALAAADLLDYGVSSSFERGPVVLSLNVEKRARVVRYRGQSEQTRSGPGGRQGSGKNQRVVTRIS